MRTVLAPLLVGVAVVACAVSASPAAAQLRLGADRDSRPRGEPRPVAGLLVQFRAGVGDAERRREISDAGGRLALRLGLVHGASVTVRDGSLETLRERLRAAPGVLRIEDNAEVHVARDPDDPGFEQQYALTDSADHDIDAPAAWNDLTSCSKVAVLDTGVQLDHPDLKSNLWANPNETDNGRDDDGNGYVDDVYGVDFIEGRGSGEDHNGHGTHVAGIIGARGNNDRGISGLCWKTKIVSVRIMDADGRGNISEQIAGIEYALRVGAKIINCSFGGTDSSSLMSDAIAQARSKGALILAAAGNEGENADATPVYPAAYPDSNVLSVAATDDRDQLASFYNYGAKTVDLAAPGDAIGSTYLESDYVYMSGTSMATPYVAAAAAMLREHNGSWDAGDLSSRLRQKGDELSALRGKTTSARRLNVNRALG
jgi:thermitase